MGGVPLLFLPLAARWGSGRPLWGGPLSPLPARGLRALLGGGSPNFLPRVDTRQGCALPCLGVSLRPLDARCLRTLLGEGSPPSYPPWLAARVKRANGWGGSTPCRFRPAYRALVACTSRSLSLSASPFSPLPLSLWWACARLPLPVSPCPGPHIISTPLRLLQRQ